MKLNRKLLMSIGAVASVAAPVFTTISCGSELVKNADGDVLMTYESADKTIYFNLNKDKTTTVDTSSIQLKQFLPAYLEMENGGSKPVMLTRDTLIGMNDCFQKATDPRFSNVDKLKNGDVMHLIFTGQYQRETQFSTDATQGFAKRPIVKLNYVMEIDYLYNDHSDITYPLMTSKGRNGRPDSTHPDQRDRERVKVRSNFLDSLIEGMQKYKILSNASADVNFFFPKEGWLTKPSTVTSGLYAEDRLNQGNIISLLKNADSTIESSLQNMPRNYETTVTLPKVDLTHPFVMAPYADFMIDSAKIGGGTRVVQASGDAVNGFHFTIESANSSDYLGQMEQHIKEFADANVSNGFFASQPAITLAWKNHKPYNPSRLGDYTAVVTATGKDASGKTIKASYEATVTVVPESY